MSEVYLNFNLDVNPLSIQALFKVVQEQLGHGMKKLNLLISSPGGNVDPGIAVYNFLKGLPIEVTTHNYGSCDSIAALIFCTGIRRFTVSNSRFLIHGLSLPINQGQVFSETSLSESLNSLKNQRETIAKIIAKECKRKLEDVEKDMLHGIILAPEEAMKYGLVTEIKNDLIPAGVNFINVSL